LICSPYRFQQPSKKTEEIREKGLRRLPHRKENEEGRGVSPSGQNLPSEVNEARGKKNHLEDCQDGKTSHGVVHRVQVQTLSVLRILQKDAKVPQSKIMSEGRKGRAKGLGKKKRIP